uniref:Radical SAM protein n=1 Tax=candidate division WOR-3 bacterium TaxID=2052148 RepID=A0A7C4U7B2_UNCW3
MAQISDENISFQWHITYLCNLRCKHCYQENFLSNNDLSFDKIRLILENLKEQFGKISINITGGEPLYKKDFFDILDIISSFDNIESFNIITNGTLLNDRNINMLKNYKKLNEIKISIDGIKANDFIRGKGLLNIVEKNIKKISGIRKIIMFTAGGYNYREIEDVFDFSYEISDGLIIERFVPLGEGMQLKEFYLKQEEWFYIVQFIKDYFFIDNLNELAKFRAFYIDFKEDEVFGALCNLGESFAIMPDGSIYPCRRLPIILGNALKTRNIKEKIDNFRKEIEKNLKGKCSKCVFFNECIGCRAGVYATKNNLFYPDEQCFI